MNRLSIFRNTRLPVSARILLRTYTIPINPNIRPGETQGSNTNNEQKQGNDDNQGEPTGNGSSNRGRLLLAFGLSALGGAAFYKVQDRQLDSNIPPVETEIANAPPLPNSNFKALPPNASVVFVLGGPGAGKGTQCSNLVRDYGFVHLSAGDLLRAERSTDSPYSELINYYIKEGKIVPMEITIALLYNAMTMNLKEGRSRFLIDGFPRKMDQAMKFEEAVCPSRFTLYFSCPETVLLNRLMKRGETSGRVDDNIESIMKRFVTFNETSMPVIDHFKKDGKVEEISCEGNIDEVYGRVKDILKRRLKI